VVAGGSAVGQQVLRHGWGADPQVMKDGVPVLCILSGLQFAQRGLGDLGRGAASWRRGASAAEPVQVCRHTVQSAPLRVVHAFPQNSESCLNLVRFVAVALVLDQENVPTNLLLGLFAVGRVDADSQHPVRLNS
jgi:hypothetical protein